MARFFIFILVLIPYCSLVTAIDVGFSRDRAALLAFAAAVSSDPHNVLANWGFRNSNMCNWTGVVCHPNKHCVIHLYLKRRGLGGVISPALANLSCLANLDLSENHFSGVVPQELGALPGLQQLSLASNLLHGSIPSEMALLKEMIYLSLSDNNLSGPIPDTLFCNCTSLQYVDLSSNSLTGKIAENNQCILNNLSYLNLWSNNFEGPIPPLLSNFSKLQGIDLESNHLSGGLPSGVFNKMPHLYLHLSYNNLSSCGAETELRPFLASLSNNTYLLELELAGNSLTGEIPSSVGDLPIGLRKLHLEDNLLYGPIPADIFNLVNLTYLNLSNNFLSGSIPPDISKLRRLERFCSSNNLLSGEIPQSLGEIPHLGLVDLSRNMLSGSIPNTLFNLSQLRRLMLHNNQLSGTIPSSLGNCTNLELLDLSHNRLLGRIPSNVGRLTSLQFYLNLSSNSLNGSLPVELSKLDKVMALDLSSNRFSGFIPPQLRSCIPLMYLNLSSNSLEGHLPGPVGALPSLWSLDVSSNMLTGEMPKSLQASTTLKQLNLSFNNFSGVVPSEGVFASLSKDSFLGNPWLCGSIPGMSSCTRRQVHHLVILTMILTLIGSSTCMVCIVGYRLLLRSRINSQASVFRHSMSRDDEEQCKKDYPRISYRELEEATGGFSDLNIIGAGRFGQVYKGILPNKMRIAVKVLKLKTDESEISASFKRECEVLRSTRHRNLIRIITTCCKPDFKALVLPLMPNGNLDGHLYPPDGSSCALSLVQLVSIASDIAEGIAYLHHYSPMKVVHCDLKPSNVLLDEDMTAIVSDFGIARLVKGGSNYESSSNVRESGSCISTTELFHGSVGYIAPEYGLGGQRSTQGDVYSFGILLLEMITEKRPTHVIFDEGLTLQEWVKSQYPHNIKALTAHMCTTTDLPPSDDSLCNNKLRRDVVIEMIELGLVCTHFTPAMRPTMVDVAHEMALLKQDLLRHDSEPPSSVAGSSF